ncbi:ATP-binding cassette domain-containing protein [Bacillus cereus]
MKVGGKSTLIDVLAGFLTPSSGKMIVNGVEIDGSTREEWQRILLIFRSNLIFSAFIKDNICFYETNTTDEEVERVINEVGLRSLVTSLPNGMYERIGEGGRMLSGGQEQRVAMARALLSKSQLFY